MFYALLNKTYFFFNFQAFLNKPGDQDDSMLDHEVSYVIIKDYQVDALCKDAKIVHGSYNILKDFGYWDALNSVKGSLVSNLIFYYLSFKSFGL